MDVQTTADAVGVALAQAYIGYGAFLLIGTIFGVHAVALAVAVYWLRPSPRFRARVLQWLLDLAYGLVNPLIYLVILRANGPAWQRFPFVRTPLTVLAWILFVVLWSLRLLCPPRLLTVAAVRQTLRVLLAAAIGVIAGHGVLDLVIFVLPPLWEGSLRLGAGDWPRTLLALTIIPASLAGLYLVPIIRAATWINRLRSAGPEVSAPGSFLLPAGAALAVRGAVAALVIVTVVSSAPRWSDRHAQLVVLAHRDDIISVADSYGVDARTLAAIMWVTERDQLSPLRDTLERSTLAAWRWDETSNFLLGSPLNISVGLMQVKPVTLQTAALIRDQALFGTASGSPAGASPPDEWSPEYKQRREVAAPNDRWSLPGDTLHGLPPPFQAPATKASVIAALLHDRSNIAAGALILALYQLQWEGADSSWSIRHRPEILATLYQIGFERSHPHATPIGNRFGRRVLEVHNRDWIETMFPASTPQSAAIGR